MSHEDIILGKVTRVRHGLEEDLGLELRSYPIKPNSFGDQFGQFIGDKFPNAKPRANGTSIGECLMMVQQTPVYRIRINNNASIDTDCYDLIDSYCPKLKNHYEKVEDLPQWVQEKLAVLMVIDPAQLGGREVTGIGRRINEIIFWVYDNGNDSRETGEGGSPQTTG